MKKLIIIVVSLLLFSCSAVKKTSQTSQSVTSKSDTVFILKKETIKDTVIKLKADSSLFEAMIECDSNNQAYIQRIITLENGQKVQTKYVFKDKILRLESKVNADSIQVFWKSFYESQYKEKLNTTINDTNREMVKKASPFAWLKWLLIGVVAGFLLKIFLPKIISLVKTFI